MMNNDRDTLIGDSSLYAQNDGRSRMTEALRMMLAHTLCAFGGGSSLRKDDGDEHTAMLREAVR
jgi:hypothetical protein